MKKFFFPLVALMLFSLCLGAPISAWAQEVEQEPAQEQAPAVQEMEREPAQEQAATAREMEEEPASGLEISVAAICKDVVEREPVDPGISFPASVGKLYCFTKVAGAQEPTSITHVWYFGSTKRASVELPVNSSSWRTYSSKIIQPHEVGAWHVEVLDSEGTVLKSLQFEITP